MAGWRGGRGDETQGSGARKVVCVSYVLDKGELTRSLLGAS